MQTKAAPGSSRRQKEKEPHARIGIPEGNSGVKKPYERFPKLPLEEKILKFVELLDAGYGRDYARAMSGLRHRRVDHKKAMEDARVVEALERNRQAFLAKQKDKWF